MSWAHCDVVTMIDGKEHVFAEISVCVMPRIGEKLRIKGKKIILPDEKLAGAHDWVVIDIRHDATFPHNEAKITNEQVISIFVEPFLGRDDN